MNAPITLNENYQANYLSLIRRFNAAAGYTPQSPEQWRCLAEWMVESLHSNVGNSTWRAYRSAIIQASGYDTLVRRILSVKGSGGKNKPRRTSAKRKKGATWREIGLLEIALMRTKTRWGPMAALWLRAGALTGLRPIEWVGARIANSEGEPYLAVCTAKRGAGNNDYGSVPVIRYVPIAHLSFREMLAVRRQIAIANRFFCGDWTSWETYYNGCRQAIYAANKRCFPSEEKLISLYTSRHRYTGDLKDAGFPTKLQGQLLGQLSGATAERAYGGRRRKESTPVGQQHIQQLESALERLQENEE